jgi:hypothetical protein
MDMARWDADCWRTEEHPDAAGCRPAAVGEHEHEDGVYYCQASLRRSGGGRKGKSELGRESRQ